MEPSPDVQEKIEQVASSLPPAAQRELLQFLSFLQDKYQTSQPQETIKLGGLWAGVDLDVSDDDVRALRQRVTDQLLTKV